MRRALAMVCASVAMIAAGSVSSAGVARPSPARPPRQVLYGVSATSATDAWAVGQDLYGSPLPGIPFSSSLILHWDGRTWSRVPSPGATEGTEPILTAVSAVSSTDVWALGSDGSSNSGSGDGRALILHWDGSSWQQFPGPGGLSVHFSGVSADSATDAWAVGTTSDRPLIVHWDGSNWKTVAVSRGATAIVGVSALSPKNVWVAGYSGDIYHAKSLLLHWDGSSWRKVRPAVAGFLVGLSPRSPGTVWAGGLAAGRGGANPSIASCHAAFCTPATHPGLRVYGTVAAISAGSPRKAWAVGDQSFSLGRGAVAIGGPGWIGWILRWNGRAWKRSSIPPGWRSLAAVSTLADGEAWAVGSRPSGRSVIPVILHWNAGSWQPQTPAGL
jgi:hypothetical protein